MKTCPLCDTGYPNHQTNCDKDGALLLESRELDPGTVIRGKYRIERLLGRGGMGTVYLAEHILLGQQRALKFISSELAQDAHFLKRFRHEAQASIKLRHTNIVEVVDLDQAEDGSPYIAMEYVEGEDLRHALADGAFPVERALAIARGIAQGLGAAHLKGIVHRDVKPENILLSGGHGTPETPRLLDFGIAAMKESVTAISRTHGLMLTPQYAAPEQWQGMASDQLDGRADLYALGGVLYEMLTGQTVFRSQNTEGWMHRHLHEEPQPPSRLCPEVDRWPGLDVLVSRLLAKDREHRPKNAAELVSLLDAVQHIAPGTCRDAEMEEADFSVSARQTWQSSKPTNRRGILFGLLAAGAILGALAVWFISQRPKQPNESARKAQLEVQPQSAISKPEQPQPVQPSSPKPANSTPNAPQGPTPGQAQVPRPSAQQLSITEIDRQATALYDQKRYAEAAPLYDQACAKGLGGDCSRLGTMYEHGEGVTQDYSRAVDLYSKGCVSGSAAGCDDLILLYKKGGATANDSARVAALFSTACEGGNANGCASLGFMYETGVGVGRDTSRAAALYSKSCDAGDARGCLNLGSMFGTGNGVTRDYSRSAMLSSKACDGGEPLGCFNVGLEYENGLGVKRDYSVAAALYAKACEAGIAIGCARLGLLYANGNGVTKDPTRAAGFFSKSCDGGLAMGCLNLGIFSETGNGIAKDFPRAATLYSKACNAGSARGCANLGSLYEYGEGVAKNYLESATLYSKACDGGDAGGCSNLGNLYRNGWGVGKDAGKAKEFLNKGCSMGNQFGCDRLKEM